MRLISIFVLFVVCPLWQPAAFAQGVIYKCLGSKGAISYQNSPCPDGSTVRSAKPYVDVPYDPALAEKVQRDRIALDERKRRSAESAVYTDQSSGPVNYKVQRCRNARARRQRSLDAAGLARTYALLQRLDREVYDACKDAPGA